MPLLSLHWLNAFTSACDKRLQPKVASSKGLRLTTFKEMKSSCLSSLALLTVRTDKRHHSSCIRQPAVHSWMHLLSWSALFYVQFRCYCLAFASLSHCFGTWQTNTPTPPHVTFASFLCMYSMARIMLQLGQGSCLAQPLLSVSWALGHVTRTHCNYLAFNNMGWRYSLYACSDCELPQLPLGEWSAGKHSALLQYPMNSHIDLLLTA